MFPLSLILPKQITNLITASKQKSTFFPDLPTYSLLRNSGCVIKLIVLRNASKFECENPKLLFPNFHFVPLNFSSNEYHDLLVIFNVFIDRGIN